MKKPEYECDLHTHTTASDGHKLPKELIDAAVADGIVVLGITDHDVVLKNRKELILYAKEKGVHLLPGIEISCDTENDDVHVIGYGCRWNSTYFEQLKQDVRKSRYFGYKELVKRLDDNGYPLDFDEILKYGGNEENPYGIMKKQIYEYMAVKGYAKTWNDAKVFVLSDETYAVKRRKPDPVDTISQIHNTGGIAILAHPFLIAEQVKYKNKSMNRMEYIDILIEAGLDGIEACYPYHKSSYQGVEDSHRIEHIIKSRYADKIRFFSGGSDYHGDDIKQAENPRLLGEKGVSFSYFRDKIWKALSDTYEMKQEKKVQDGN